MTCLKCRLRWWYYTLLKWLMFPVRTVAGRINVVDQVTAILIKDGKVIKRIVGVRMHNRWLDGGLDSIAQCLRLGASDSPGLKLEYMRLGTQCSDTAFTFIAGSEQGTANTDPGGLGNVKATADWTAGPAIVNICQVKLRHRSYTGVGTVDSSIYNFGAQFTKPNAVDLVIEWTVTLSRA